MKKYILLGIVMLLLLGSTISITANNKELDAKTADFTHTVFAEECTATWCPNCPMAAEALYNIYVSGDYPFYYVAMVDDMSTIAKSRNKEYVFGIVKGYAFPTVYFDGGDTNFDGLGSTVPATETEYRSLIEQEGTRTPKQPITMNSSVIWEGNAKLTITISITNDGSLPYLGRLRSYVTEIESRWNDNSGDPYHFAFLDYAVNKLVLLMPGKTKTVIGSFDGNSDHGGQTFGDITSDNIMVISAIFNWIPHYRIGFESETFTQRYFARFADQATAAVPA
jgi:hypothetical protein